MGGRIFYLLGGVLDQALGVPFAPGPRFRADVDEVPGVGVVAAEDVVFGVVQQGEELVEEAPLALLGELPVEAEHAAPEHGAEVVHVFVRGHPVFLGALVLVVQLLTHSLIYWRSPGEEFFLFGWKVTKKRTKELHSRNSGQ